MKGIVVFAALAALALVAYKVHRDSVESAAREARAEAFRSARPKAGPPPTLQQVAISRVIEPLYSELFSDLSASKPEDLAPPIEVTRQRILDKRAHANAEKQRVYDLGASLLEAMIVLAEERTKALQSLLESTGTKGALDAPNTTTSSGAFFAQSAIRRWEEEKRRQKPRLDLRFAELRTAERAWNQRAGEKAPVDAYDLPVLEPVYITTEKSVGSTNPLEKRAYDNRRVMYPWRRSYYDRYGYPVR